MIVKCPKCETSFDDEFRWTICPHETFAANDGQNNFAHHPESFIAAPAAPQSDQPEQGERCNGRVGLAAPALPQCVLQMGHVGECDNGWRFIGADPAVQPAPFDRNDVAEILRVARDSGMAAADKMLAEKSPAAPSPAANAEQPAQEHPTLTAMRAIDPEVAQAYADCVPRPDQATDNDVKATTPSPAANAEEVAAGYFDPNDIRERWAQVYNHTTFHGATKTAELDTATFDAFNHDLPALLESFRAETLEQAAQRNCIACKKGYAFDDETHTTHRAPDHSQRGYLVIYCDGARIRSLGPDPNWLARQIAEARLEEVELAHAQKHSNHACRFEHYCWFRERIDSLVQIQATKSKQEHSHGD